MTIMKLESIRTTALAAAAAGAMLVATAASAQDYNITVWAGGSNDADIYRVEAIEMAADILEREMAILGEEVNIEVDGRIDFGSWDEFKQAVTLGVESGTGPNIVVTSHGDIAPWSSAGIIRPVEDYVDLDAWPLNDIYDNLIEISSFDGIVYGIPQDAESRPFFAWIPHMRAIGYSDEEIAALPARVQSGDYTLYDVLDDAEAMQEAGLVEPGYGFYPRVSNGPDYWQFYQSFGGEMHDSETGQLVLDTEAMTRFYQFFADAVDRGVTRRNHIGTPWDQWYAEVASGQAGLWHGGTWHYARYTGNEGLDDFFGNVQFSLIPSGGDGGGSNTITHPLVYLVTSQDDEDTAFIAAELIKIASEPRINTLHAILSAHLGISESQSQVDLYSGDRWAREATDRLLPYATAMPNHVGFGDYWNLMWAGLESVWAGQATPEEAVEGLQVAAQNALGDDIVIR